MPRISVVYFYFLSISVDKSITTWQLCISANWSAGVPNTFHILDWHYTLHHPVVFRHNNEFGLNAALPSPLFVLHTVWGLEHRHSKSTRQQGKTPIVIFISLLHFYKSCNILDRELDHYRVFFCLLFLKRVWLSVILGSQGSKKSSAC